MVRRVLMLSLVMFAVLSTSAAEPQNHDSVAREYEESENFRVTVNYKNITNYCNKLTN